jgi:hypothetical protein
MHRNKITAIRTDTIEQWTFSRSIGVSEDIVCEICGAASEWLSLAYAMQFAPWPKAEGFTPFKPAKATCLYARCRSRIQNYKRRKTQ